MAHLYEPLSDDNSTGVAGAIEIVRIIKKMIAQKELPELEFSIRVVCAWLRELERLNKCKRLLN